VKTISIHEAETRLCASCGQHTHESARSIGVLLHDARAERVFFALGSIGPGRVSETAAAIPRTDSSLGRPRPYSFTKVEEMARGGDAKAYFRLTSKGLREVREAYATLSRLWQVLTELKRREAVDRQTYLRRARAILTHAFDQRREPGAWRHHRL
jgi:hypothetical protein